MGQDVRSPGGPRCIALVGPFQSGKTTLLEAILARTGAIPRAGSVDAGTSVGDATAEAVRRAGIDTVGLLGTGFTMAQDFYRGRLESHGLTVLVPDEDDQALVHRVIYDELCLGVVREESRAAYVEVVDRLVAQGAQGVILGCTEIEMLLQDDDVPVPTFPTTRLHVEAAVDQALA